MGRVIDSRIKPQNVIIRVLHIDFEVMAVKHNSSTNYCYDHWHIAGLGLTA